MAGDLRFMGDQLNNVGGSVPGAPVMRSAPVKSGASTPSTRQPMTSQPGGIPQINPQMLPAGGGIAPMLGGYTPSVTQIDGSNPSLRGSEIGFNIPTGVFNPTMMGSAPTLDFGGFSLDPSMFAGGGQFSAGGGGGGGFTVSPQSVKQQAIDTFHSQLPQMNINFGDEVENLAKRTAAMGRTGSGLFNRDTDLMSSRQLAAREALLGNIGLSAATTDAGNDLQAQIATGQFDSQAKQRGLQSSMHNSSNALQAALQNAAMNQRGQMFDVGNQMTVDQFNTGMLNDAGLWNVQNAQNMGMAGLAHTLGERSYQDNLAAQAQNDLAAQMGYLQGGFSGNPADYGLGAAGALGNMAGMFGSNAAQTSAGAGQSIAALMQMLSGGGGGGGGGGIGGILGDALGGLLGGIGGGGGGAAPVLTTDNWTEYV